MWFGDFSVYMVFVFIVRELLNGWLVNKENRGYNM